MSKTDLFARDVGFDYLQLWAGPAGYAEATYLAEGQIALLFENGNVVGDAGKCTFHSLKQTFADQIAFTVLDACWILQSDADAMKYS